MKDTVDVDLEEVFPEIPGYEIIREIGGGGQAIILLARKLSTSRKVAIKLLPHTDFSGEELSSLQREVQVLAKLDHPNIVSVYDNGITTEGWPFFVMEYVRGLTLAEYLDELKTQNGPPTRGGNLEKVIRLFIRICEVVNAAHIHGIVHRDLKPSNIIIDKYGEPHIMDFGLAHGSARWITLENDFEDSTSMIFKGSIPWAAPEQAEGDLSKIDTRTDVYALGVLIYEVLKGEFPYDVFSDPYKALQNIRNCPPRPLQLPQALRPQTNQYRKGTQYRFIDERLESIIFKALSKRNEDRYFTAGGFAEEMTRWLTSSEPLPETLTQSAPRTGTPPYLYPLLGFNALLLILVAVLLITRPEPTATDLPSSSEPITPDRPAPSSFQGSPMGYRVVKDKIRFEFDPKDYPAARYPDGTMNQLPPLKAIHSVNVAGSFNGWTTSDQKWVLHQTASGIFVLEKPASLFQPLEAWDFKFVLNEEIWVGAPESAPNKMPVKIDPGSFNFVLYPHSN